MFKFKVLFQISLFFIGLIVTSSCDNKLTRSKAAEKIKTSQQFSPTGKTYTISLCIGYPCYQFREGIDAQEDRNRRDALKKAGYVEFERIRQETAGYDGYQFAFTPKGNTSAKKWSHEVEVNAYSRQPIGFTRYTIPVGQPEFIEVTGIQANQQMAGAGFTWKFVPTTIGDELMKAGWKTNEFKKQHEGSASFQLYDDGWRLTEVHLY